MADAGSRLQRRSVLQAAYITYCSDGNTCALDTSDDDNTCTDDSCDPAKGCAPCNGGACFSGKCVIAGTKDNRSKSCQDLKKFETTVPNGNRNTKRISYVLAR